MKFIDVSSYQNAAGPIDWKAVKTSGVEGVFVKIGGSEIGFNFFDSNAFKNIAGVKAVGLPVGYYWFSSALTSMGSQLAKIKDAISLAGLPDLGIMIDVERPVDGPAGIDLGINLAEEVEMMGIRSFIYTAAWCWNGGWKLSEYFAKKGPLVKIPLCVADYSKTPSSGAGPIIPNGWKDWIMWQYSDTGRVPGITGPCDLIEAKEIKMRGQPRIQYGRVYHVLPQNATPEQIKKVMDAAYPTRQTVGFSYDDAGVGDLDDRTAVVWNIPESDRPSFSNFFATYYPGVKVAFKSTESSVDPNPPPTPPQPPTPPSVRFWSGLNFPSGNLHLAIQAARDGCRAFTVIDDFTGAGQVYDAAPGPDMYVIARRTGFRRGVSAQDIVNGLEGAWNKNLIYMGVNEGDAEGQDGEDLRVRLRRDVEVARLIKNGSGARYVAGTFSMGCPDFTSQSTCDIIRAELAPAYNAGLIWLDLHPYAPVPSHINEPDSWIWFIRRWEFFFTKCGLDPRVRNVVFSECGLDEGGVGGFVGHNYSVEQFRDFFKKYRAAQEKDIIVNGVAYPSPIRAGAYFQRASAAWGSYEMASFVDVMKTEGW